MYHYKRLHGHDDVLNHVNKTKQLVARHRTSKVVLVIDNVDMLAGLEGVGRSTLQELNEWADGKRLKVVGISLVPLVDLRL